MGVCFPVLVPLEGETMGGEPAACVALLLARLPLPAFRSLAHSIVLCDQGGGQDAELSVRMPLSVAKAAVRELMLGGIRVYHAGFGFSMHTGKMSKRLVKRRHQLWREGARSREGGAEEEEEGGEADGDSLAGSDADRSEGEYDSDDCDSDSDSICSDCSDEDGDGDSSDEDGDG